MLFEFPKQAYVGKTVPKSNFYRYGNSTAKIRDIFVSQVAEIRWEYLLAPKTLNITDKKKISEVQIFSIKLYEENIDEALLAYIDSVIRFPILFELHYENKIKSALTYKRKNEADPSRRVTYSYLYGEWQDVTADRVELPLTLDLEKLYEKLVTAHIPIAQRKNESLRQLVERNEELSSYKKEARKLEKRIEKEKQFNRKVELNHQLKEIETRIDELEK